MGFMFLDPNNDRGHQIDVASEKGQEYQAVRIFGKDNPDTVFTYKGRPVTKANNHAWRKALVRAGIKNFRWHDLRQTWASWHVQQGTPLHVLQELGGWSDYEMVRRYAHLSVAHLAEYADSLSKIQLGSTKLAQSENEAEKKQIA